jgi:hypothetical protein
VYDKFRGTVPTHLRVTSERAVIEDGPDVGPLAVAEAEPSVLGCGHRTVGFSSGSKEGADVVGGRGI